jgi:hypothetical protein
MLPRFRLFAAVVAVAILAGSLSAAPLTDSLTKGTPELKSAGALTFGPEGILFVADPTGGTIFAIATGDAEAQAAPIKVEGLKDKLASLLGTDAKALLVNDMAVNPQSGKAYLSIARGTGPDAKPAIVRIDSKGTPELFDLKFASVKLPNAGRLIPSPTSPTARKGVVAGTVERGVRLQPAVDPVPVPGLQQGGGHRDLSWRARPLRDPRRSAP